MGLTSIFQRKPGKKSAAAPAADAPADLVQQARTRARRRLIGAVVLVVVGVVGFPLLFETQPRPIPVDIPIDIPRKETAPPLVMPAARQPVKPVTQAPSGPSSASSATSQVETEAPADAARDATPPKPAAAPQPARPTKPAPVMAKAAPEKDPPRDASAREAAAKEAPGRYVVQVGAFSDSAAARETRQKVEKLGLKTYTQVAETAQGNRIRVRVGPFASREEADRVQAKLKAAGAPAVVLTL
jgi:DedD protein